MEAASLLVPLPITSHAMPIRGCHSFFRVKMVVFESSWRASFSQRIPSETVRGGTPVHLSWAEALERRSWDWRRFRPAGTRCHRSSFYW